MQSFYTAVTHLPPSSHPGASLNLIGPLALLPSTLFPFCVAHTLPCASSLTAASRVACMRGRHAPFSPSSLRGISLGQQEAPGRREARRDRIVCSSVSPSGVGGRWGVVGGGDRDLTRDGGGDGAAGARRGGIERKTSNGGVSAHARPPSVHCYSRKKQGRARGLPRARLSRVRI